VIKVDRAKKSPPGGPLMWKPRTGRGKSSPRVMMARGMEAFSEVLGASTS
jgi:hypothetical protein